MKFSPFVVLAASFFSTVVVASTQSIGSISVDTVASSLDLSPAALIETLEATKTTNVDLSDIQDSLTNGERFQLGLQPKAPKKRGSPTRRNTYSPAPSVTSKGKITVSQASDNTPLGYLRYDSSGGGIGFGTSPYSQSTNPPVVLSFVSSVGSDYASGLSVYDESATTNPYLGIRFAEKGDGTSDLKKGSINYANVVTTGSVAETPTASSADFDSLPYETTIWNYDATSGDFTATYTNMDGSTAPLTFFKPSGTSTGIQVTADLDAHLAEYPELVGHITILLLHFTPA